MTLVELALLIAAVSFAVLTGYLVSLLIQTRRTVAEAGDMLAKLNAELPSLVAELRSLSHSWNQLLATVHLAVELVSELLHAAGEVGHTVQDVHRGIRHSGERLLAHIAGFGTGIKAAVQMLRERWRQGGTIPPPADRRADDQRRESVRVPSF